MLQVREFLLKLSLCPGLSPISRWRLWQTAEKARSFNNLSLLIERSGISIRAQNALLTKWDSIELREKNSIKYEAILYYDCG